MKKSFINKTFVIFAIFTLSLNVFAWDGRDRDGNRIHVPDNTIIREGERIKLRYEGEDIEFTVDRVDGKQLELTNDDTGETIEVDMSEPE
jgi:hypothetical protein